MKTYIAGAKRGHARGFEQAREKKDYQTEHGRVVDVYDKYATQEEALKEWEGKK